MRTQLNWKSLSKRMLFMTRRKLGTICLRSRISGEILSQRIFRRAIQRTNRESKKKKKRKMNLWPRSLVGRKRLPFGTNLGKESPSPIGPPAFCGEFRMKEYPQSEFLFPFALLNDIHFWTFSFFWLQRLSDKFFCFFLLTSSLHIALGRVWFCQNTVTCIHWILG